MRRIPKRHRLTVYSDSPGGRRCSQVKKLLWVCPEIPHVIQRSVYTVTEVSEQSWVVSECPSPWAKVPTWVTEGWPP